MIVDLRLLIETKLTNKIMPTRGPQKHFLESYKKLPRLPLLRQTGRSAPRNDQNNNYAKS